MNTKEKYEQMAINYLGNVIEQAQSGEIEILDKEVKENGDIEVTLTYG